jgi:hypothetical protein
MRPLGRPAGAASQIPARPAALARRERARGGPGATGVRFGALDRAETQPVMAVGGAPRWRSRWSLFR